MVAERSSETSVQAYDPTRRNNPEDYRLSNTVLYVCKIITIIVFPVLESLIHVSQLHYRGFWTPWYCVTPLLLLVHCRYLLYNTDFYIVKLSAFLVKARVRAESESKPSRVFNVGTRQRCVFSVMPLPFLFLEERPRCPLDKRFRGSQKSCPFRKSNSDYHACSQELCWHICADSWLGSCSFVSCIKAFVQFIRLECNEN
jgi:hypothetical protein